MTHAVVRIFFNKKRKQPKRSLQRKCNSLISPQLLVTWAMRARPREPALNFALLSALCGAPGMHESSLGDLAESYARVKTR